MLALSGCDVEISSGQPERSAKIPAEAFWLGGPEAGFYILIKPSNNRDVYLSEIYYESGDLAYKGPMILYPEGSEGIDVSNEELFKFWDGKSLYLNNDLYLKAQ